jgi:DNA primase
LNKLYHKSKKEIHSTHVFDTKDIYNVLNSLNVIELISIFITLKRCQNGDYVGKCPICFNNSKSLKNFRIHRKTRKFKCFSCCISGNGIKFLMLLKNIPFDTALILANNLMFKKPKTLKIITKKKHRNFKTLKNIAERVKLNNNVEDENLPF